MRTRLNVTEAERLCYSRRKLHAISALRNAGLDPTVCGLHKDYRVPGMRGKVYLLEHPSSIVYAFSTLAEIETYAAGWQARKAQQRSTWNPWRMMPPLTEPKRVDCVWPECPYYANGLFASQPLCRAHAIIYEQMLAARTRQLAVSVSQNSQSYQGSGRW
jgi:hypothetical protein